MTDKPALLIVAPSAELYGSDRALLSALPELTEAFRVTLAVPAAGPAVALAVACGAEVIVLPDYAIRRRNLSPTQIAPWVARTAVALTRLHRLHRQRRFALLYSNTLAAGIGFILRPLLRIPHVVHVHECPSGRPRLVGLLLLVTRLSSDRVICNSAYSRHFLTDHQPSLVSHSVVIHNGIDLPEPLASRASMGTFRVTCVARIHPKKGHEVLIESIRHMETEGRPVELHVFGDNLPEHEDLRCRLEHQVEQSGLQDAVIWHGFVDDTAAMYRDCDVAVVPSVVPEEFSLVCVEAQSMTLPVVVTGPGGASEVVVDGETGLVVPPGDARALADALSALERDPDRRRRMGRLGRERMVAKFSRAPYARRVRDLCLEMVAEEPTQRVGEPEGFRR